MWKQCMYLMSIALILVLSAGPMWADQIWEGQIETENDDVEQRAAAMYMDSSDLEFVDDSNVRVGLRFVGVPIPKGSAISKAYVEFQVDEVEGDQPANLIGLVFGGE